MARVRQADPWGFLKDVRRATGLLGQTRATQIRMRSPDQLLSNFSLLTSVWASPAPSVCGNPLRAGEQLLVGDLVGAVHTVDDEMAVKVVGLMLPDACQEAVSLRFDYLAGGVEGFDPATLGSADVYADVRYGQTPFLRLLRAGEIGQLGIDIDMVVLGTTRGVADKQAEVCTNLGTGQSDAPACVHKGKHPGDQIAERAVKNLHRPAPGAQAHVGIHPDLDGQDRAGGPAAARVFTFL